MTEDPIWFVLINCPNEAVAEDIGEAAIHAGLAKMFNISAPMRTGYLWKDEFVRASEVQLSFKIHGRDRDGLFALAKARHPFAVPSIVAWPIHAIDSDYRGHIADG